MRLDPDGILVLVGTKKGAFIFQSGDERKEWNAKGPYFKGSEVYHMVWDHRDGKSIYAAVNTSTFGPSIYKSRDHGLTWDRLKESPRFRKGSRLSVEKIWHIEPGQADEPSTLYAGVQPAALFRSDDSGETWSPVDGLNNHPTRKQWAPGAGGLALHSILVDPTNAKRMYVGISAAGVFGTRDGGEEWRPLNKGVRADFMPNKYPEVGQCVHKLILTSGKGVALFQQNHCGVYRSDSFGEEWVDISNGLPSRFGFPMAAHQSKTGTLFVVPEESDDFRVAPKGEFAIYRTRDAGKHWERFDRGLPSKPAYLHVLREALATDSLDPAGVYVGTSTGQIFYSRNEGASWKLLADCLPPVYSMSCAIL